MGALLLQIPDVLYQAALDIAEQENIPINQLVTLALAEKISALMTEDYRSERARDDTTQVDMPATEQEE